MKNTILVLFVFIFFAQMGCKNKNTSFREEKNDPIRNMIVAKTIKEKFPDGANNIIVGSIVKQIDRRAQEVNAQYQKSVDLWKTSGNTSQIYYEAAMVLLENMELNQNQLLTIGNVVKCLGFPESIEEPYESLFDMQGNINADVERFDWYYKEGNLSLKFSASGFLNALLVKKDGAFCGQPPIHWPHDYSMLKTFPIFAGTFRNDESKGFLFSEAEKFIKENLKKSADDPNLGYFSPEGKKIYSLKDYSLNVYMVDGVSSDIAIVYFVLKGNVTVHQHLWLKYTDKKWEMISDKEAFSKLSMSNQKK
jgi:hypothetical protein